eukprot:gnl/TRDRNA2_/TRDRNA2_172250_c0_seq1.p1 gnl/TRDRNA2_/TRDRNA2_172250_c0~~gnl/TRDRNA2_/TRDRNA2_172250_c0_seq1.p1  ORF type:complete len:289 (+),score=98.55 gnl/TRDRNA2_/TRDRNA2_172250_c0_seq1:60-926(+)
MFGPFLMLGRGETRKWWLPVVTLLPIQRAMATMRLPEQFNVIEDFQEKEWWRGVEWELKCPLCKLTIRDTLEKIGDTFIEDDIYDHIDTICDKEDLYKSHSIILDIEEDGFLLAPEENTTDSRTEKQKTWQTHAMQELCDNLIKPHDDDIKDFLMKSLRRSKEKGNGRLGDKTNLTDQACERLDMCDEIDYDEMDEDDDEDDDEEDDDDDDSEGDEGTGDDGDGADSKDKSDEADDGKDEGDDPSKTADDEDDNEEDDDKDDDKDDDDDDKDEDDDDGDDGEKTKDEL